MFCLLYRGSLRTVAVGIFVALFSGAGVAISILGGNIGVLVGVAISASLLPPAVNAVRQLASKICTVSSVFFSINMC